MQWSLRGAGASVGWWRTGALALIVALALAACADPQVTGPSGATTSGFAALPSCVYAPMITADAALYRDEPQYGNATDLADQVMAWASGQAGFEQLWLDRDHHGWITVGFHGADVAALQQQVTQAFPGEGVVVVALAHTLAELQALMDRVMPALSAAGADPPG